MFDRTEIYGHHGPTKFTHKINHNKSTLWQLRLFVLCPSKEQQCHSCLLLGGACVSCRIICKSVPSLLLPYQLTIENSPGGYQGGLGGRRQWKKSRNHRHWSYFRYFPMTPGPSQGRYHIHHFNLMMEYCCTHSTLGFGGLDHAQFVMGSSDPVVIWWPMVKHLASTKAQ